MTAGINDANVARYFAEHVPGATAEIEVGLISGGRSNLTYWVRSNGKTWVLRRPPLGHLLPTAHDMSREFNVLSGMAKTNVPAPQPIALCEDPSVNDVPFYVMEYFDGVVIGEVKLEGYAESVPERHAMSHAMIDTLVKLHGVDYNAVGLGEFGRPDGYLSRQVRRWGEQWERSKTRELDTVPETIRRLNLALPTSPTPTVVHGDYRLGNMILSHDDPGNVLAVLDWEMATLGDPLTDLGYTLVFWGEPGDSELRLEATLGGDITAEGGFLSRAELAAEYGRLSGRNMEHMDWYEVFGFYKLGVILEGIHNRFLAGDTVGEGFEGYGRRAELLFELGLEAANRSADPRLRGA